MASCIGKLQQLQRSGPAVLGVSGHQQGFQLLVCVGGVLLDLLEAVVDVTADLHGQGRQQMVIFRGRLGYVANPEFALDVAKPGVRIMRPEVQIVSFCYWNNIRETHQTILNTSKTFYSKTACSNCK
jgi:hypothetical protein